METRRLIPLLLRDGSVLLLTLAGWALVLRGAGVALNIAAGLLTVVVGYLLHEWGHLLGALSRRSAVQLPDSVAALFLFNFDVGRNDRRQFNAMAMGGFISSIAYVIALALLVPVGLLAGKIALTLTAIGVAATLIFEVPTAWRVFRGAPLPAAGPAFVSTPPAGEPPPAV